ncbi:hypothetical protein MUN76_15430 [Leucobacter rhizosphaerae]|uniref:Uncharacterized protein n=1 Tax=Leucobacter rhizosphaerae TaxID=2932245 RepID=A0ABY4FVU7_9MICO|nr:hypothetical protein [Leucobacter rhizosphaerae]UOQ60400.1 hypothetical protein MUN76_15430 [Leucobacter rhizosphaerae]
MYRSNTIIVDACTWLILREFPQHPKAVVHKMTDTTGEDRYLLMTWDADPAKRRMVGIHKTLGEAEKAVPWPSNQGVTPPLPPRGR